MSDHWVERNYKIKWRLVPIPSKREDPSYWFFFAKKWADFMRTLLSIKVTKKMYSELPAIRELIPKETRSEEWRDFLSKRNESLAKNFMEVSTVFDDKPKVFKAFVLVVMFGFDSETFSSMLNSLNSNVEENPSVSLTLGDI